MDDPSTRATASGRGLAQDSAPQANQQAPRAMPVGLHTLERCRPQAAWQSLQDRLAAALCIPLRIVDASCRLLTAPSWPGALDADGIIQALHVGEELECLLPSGSARPQAVICQTAWGATYAAIPWGLRPPGPRAFLVLGPLLVGHAAHPSMPALKTMSHAGLSSLSALLEELGRAQPDVANEMRQARSTTPAACAILAAALAAVPADGGSVMCYDAEREDFEICAAEGLREPWAIAAARRRIGDGIAGLAALEQAVLLVDDQNNDPRIRERMARPDVVSSIVAPVSIGAGRPILGVLNLRSQTPLRRFTQNHVAIIRKFVPLAAHALALTPSA